MSVQRGYLLDVRGHTVHADLFNRAYAPRSRSATGIRKIEFSAIQSVGKRCTLNVKFSLYLDSKDERKKRVKLENNRDRNTRAKIIVAGLTGRVREIRHRGQREIPVSPFRTRAYTRVSPKRAREPHGGA